MTTSLDNPPEPIKVRFEEATMWVELSDGRTLGMPLAWYPRLKDASENDLADHFLSPSGVHWDKLDEDLSVRGMLLGLKDGTVLPAHAA
jgi:Protein of unknown function (DUF2442)